MRKARRFTPLPGSVFGSGVQFEYGALVMLGPFEVALEEGRCVLSPETPFAANAVLQALAVELYLKCLHVLDHGWHGDTHSLHDLFWALTPATQAAVRALYLAWITANPPPADLPLPDGTRVPVDLSLDAVLDSHRGSFVEWRFPHEWPVGAPVPWFGMALLRPLRRAIVARDAALAALASRLPA